MKTESLPRQPGSTDVPPLSPALPTDPLTLFRTLGLDLGVRNIMKMVDVLTQENSSHQLQLDTAGAGAGSLPVGSAGYVQASEAAIVPSVCTGAYRQVRPPFLSQEKARGSTPKTCRLQAREPSVSGSQELAVVGDGQAPGSKPKTSLPTPARNSLQEHFKAVAKTHGTGSSHPPLPKSTSRPNPAATTLLVPSLPRLTKKTPRTSTKGKSRQAANSSTRYTPKAASSCGKPRASRPQCPGRRTSPPGGTASHTIPEYFQTAGARVGGREQPEIQCPPDQLVPDWTQSGEQQLLFLVLRVVFECISLGLYVATKVSVYCMYRL